MGQSVVSDITKSDKKSIKNCNEKIINTLETKYIKMDLIITAFSFTFH